MSKLLPAVLSVLLATGCAYTAREAQEEPGGGGGAARPSAMPSAMATSTIEGTPVTFKVLEKGTQSLLTKDTELSFSDPVSYANWYKSHTHDRKPPVVNFDKEQALVVVLPRNTGGFSVNLDAVTATPELVTVSYTETRPTKDMMVIEALTQPFFVAVIPKQTGKVVFAHHIKP
jgi:hypothetical protein